MKKIEKIPIIIALVFLLIAFTGGMREWDLSEGFFTLLRIIVCGVSVYLAWVYAQESKKIIFWCLVLVAIVFNPIIQVHLEKETWIFVDLVVAIFIFEAAFHQLKIFFGLIWAGFILHKRMAMALLLFGTIFLYFAMRYIIKRQPDELNPRAYSSQKGLCEQDAKLSGEGLLSSSVLSAEIIRVKKVDFNIKENDADDLSILNLSLLADYPTNDPRRMSQIINISRDLTRKIESLKEKIWENPEIWDKEKIREWLNAAKFELAKDIASQQDRDTFIKKYEDGIVNSEVGFNTVLQKLQGIYLDVKLKNISEGNILEPFYINIENMREWPAKDNFGNRYKIEKQARNSFNKMGYSKWYPGDEDVLVLFIEGRMLDNACMLEVSIRLADSEYHTDHWFRDFRLPKKLIDNGYSKNLLKSN